MQRHAGEQETPSSSPNCGGAAPLNASVLKEDGKRAKSRGHREKEGAFGTNEAFREGMGARLGGLERSHPGRGHAGGSSGVVRGAERGGVQTGPLGTRSDSPMGLCVAEHVVLTLHGTGSMATWS